MALNKHERAFLKQAAGPGEKCYEVKLTLKFLADPSMDFDTVREKICELVRGSLGRVTMPTKRIDTYVDMTLVDL